MALNKRVGVGVVAVGAQCEPIILKPLGVVASPLVLCNIMMRKSYVLHQRGLVGLADGAYGASGTRLIIVV